MRGRVGAVILVLGLLAAGLAAGAIQAGPTAPPTTTEPPTTEETTTTTSSTAATTTAPAVSTTTTVAAPAPRTPIGAGSPVGDDSCLVGAFVLMGQDGQTRVLGPTARPTTHDVAASSVAYPADGSVLVADSLSLHAAGCGAGGHAEVRSVSLFDGAITARSVALAVSNKVSSSQVRIEGLEIRGKPASLVPGRPLPVGNWGDATALAHANSTDAAALAVHLTKAHAGLPAGTTLFVSFARVPLRPERKTSTAASPRHAAKPETHRPDRTHTEKQRRARSPKQKHQQKKQRKRHRRKRLGDEPLTMTPPLGPSHYVFPVAGESSYIDTYGGFRGDVPGNWHHGEDIFAAVGTPVVAVADGTLNRVGWQRLGGWRVWVRDHMRNQFYYAHLSGYSPLALKSRRLKAGNVIGFIGNTGDAFTTPPHLHFEIHPHQLLRLDYNGAVNPTSYLNAWPHVAHPRTPKPAHPPFPKGPVRAEARYVWRQLLAARGLIPHAPRVGERPHIRVPLPDRVLPGRRLAAASTTTRLEGGDDAVLAAVLVVGILASALLFGSALFRLRRRPS